MESKPIHNLIWDDLGCVKCRLRVGEYTECYGPPLGDAFYCNSETWYCLRDRKYHLLESFTKNDSAPESITQGRTLGVKAVRQIIPKADF